MIITASITIDCGAGNIGNIASSTADGIKINTSNSAIIVLRHLAMNGLNGNSINGINAGSFFGGVLIVDDCSIHGYSDSIGISFVPIHARGLLQVTDSQIFNNIDGIYVGPETSVIASVTLDNVKLTGNGNGLVLDGAGVVAGTMRNSIVGSNNIDGILATAGQVFSRSRRPALSPI